VAVYNNGRAIERTVDKAMTSFLLHRENIPTPTTWVCESRAQAISIVQRETMAGHPVVVKPLFGSQGIGVHKLENVAGFPVPMEEHIDGVYYLQSYINSGQDAWHDYRVFVINNQVVSAMVRHGNTWINNVAQGGSCEPLVPDPGISRLALAAARAVQTDYCGVDIIRDQAGRLYVLEVNSIPAWQGLQKVSTCNIAEALVDDFLSGFEDISARNLTAI
jgi:tetrahydromethanopterin:alpha-L-glutamate ligase